MPNLVNLTCRAFQLLDTSFVGLSRLESLKLDQCDCKYFDMNAFRHLPNVEKLTVRMLYNEEALDLSQLGRLKQLYASFELRFPVLETINTEHFVELHVWDSPLDRMQPIEYERVFNRFTNLQVLDLQYHEIECFQLVWLSHLANLKQVILSTREPKRVDMYWYYDIDDMELCLKSELEGGYQVDDDDDDEDEDDGNEFEDGDDDDEVDMAAELGLGRGLLNLEELTLINFLFTRRNQTRIAKPSRDMFAHFPNLKKLFLFGNRLNFSIDDNLFADLVNLEELSLQKNNLTRVSGASFAGLAKLKYLDLSRNPLELIEPSVFADLANLETVKLNRINFENKQRFEEVYGKRIKFEN